MNLRVPKLLSHLGAKQQCLLLGPLQRPCKQPQGQTLKPSIQIRKAPGSHLFVVTIFRPCAKRPLEIVLFDIDEASLLHHSFVVTGCFGGAVEDLAAFAEVSA